MEPDTDVKRTARKQSKTKERALAKVVKLEAELKAAKQMAERVESDAEKREALDEAAIFAASLKSEQQAYLRAKRKDFGLPRRVDEAKTKKQPPDFVAFMAIYDAWIKSRRPVGGIAVDWQVLIKKTGRQERQVRTYVDRLIGRGHLVKLSGGKGRAQRLFVGPAGYPIDIDDQGNYKYLPGSLG